MEGLVQACKSRETQCREWGERLARVVGKAVVDGGCDCLLYSGGVDTAFVLASGLRLGWRPRLVSVVFPGGGDWEYIAGTPLEEGLEHVIVKVNPRSQRVGECLERVLRILSSIDPIEIAAGITACLGLDTARRMGCGCVATGDAGDELFYGYGFLLGKSREYLEEWLEWVLEGARYSSKPIGENMGLHVLHPLDTSGSREVARTCPLECKVADLGEGRWVGKLLLRCLLYEWGWRKHAVRGKEPITSGSGVERLIGEWASRASLGEAVELYSREGIILPTRSHVFLYRLYRRLGLPRPRECSGGNSCPLCGSCLTSRGYCGFCGAVLAEGGRVSYHGGGGDILGKLLGTLGLSGVFHGL